MHVLPVLEPAGAERIAAELAKRLRPHGFSTRVLCLEDERALIGEELRAAGVPVEGLRLSRRRTLACARGIARRIPAERPLILHGHLFHANIATRLAFARLPKEQRREVRVISTVQVVERRFRPWQFALDRWTARYGAAEVCVSEDVRRFQQRKTRLPPEFFEVIENAVDVERLVPREDVLGNPARPHIVAVGRLNPQKDYPTLLRAWGLVAAQRPAARLTIAGDGPERGRLEALASSIGPRNIRFAGFVGDIPGLLASADLFVQASLWEGLPLSVIEAMAAGLPVVATEADGTRNVLESGRTGVLVPCSNPQALARAMLEIIDGPARARQLGKEARRVALERFSIDGMVERYAALYLRVLSEGSAAASSAPGWLSPPGSASDGSAPPPPSGRVSG